ncbi:MAG: response regulator [Thiotrichales bacterium]
MVPKILIVDDEPAICHNLGAFLEDEGFQVTFAHSGEEALGLVREGSLPRLCIMDLRLPGMNGLDTIIALHHHLPDLRFIVHSGSAPEDVESDLASAGLQNIPIFKKPISDMERIIRVIKERC